MCFGQFQTWMYFHSDYLRNKSWKPECALSFNMDWQILVFYPEPEARDNIYYYPPTHHDLFRFWYI